MEGEQDPPEAASGDETEPGREGGQEQRIETLESKVDQILGLLSRTPENRSAGREDAGPPTVAHEIRQQLDERDRRDREAAAAQGQTDRLGAVETRLAELTEKPPVAPVRKVTKLMWGDG